MLFNFQDVQIHRQNLQFLCVEDVILHQKQLKRLKMYSCKYKLTIKI